MSPKRWQLDRKFFSCIAVIVYEIEQTSINTTTNQQRNEQYIQYSPNCTQHKPKAFIIGFRKNNSHNSCSCLYASDVFVFVASITIQSEQRNKKVCFN